MTCVSFAVFTLKTPNLSLVLIFFMSVEMSHVYFNMTMSPSELDRMPSTYVTKSGTSVSPAMSSVYVHTSFGWSTLLQSKLLSPLLSMSHACLGVVLASIASAVSVHPSPMSHVSPTVSTFSAVSPCSKMSFVSLLVSPLTATLFAPKNPTRP